ncbi:Uncharacterised protein g2701 [Pycnogonum litorale]
MATQEEIKAARSKRTSAKRNLTRCINNVMAMISGDYGTEELQEAKERLISRDETISKHDELCELIDCDADKEGCADSDSEEKWADEIEETVRTCIHNLYSHLQQKNNHNGVNGSTDNNRTETVANNAVYFEKPKLPMFDGSIKEFVTFKEEFRLHINDNLPNDTAAMLLRNCLGPGPRSAVRGLGLNYQLMWKELEETYGNPRQVSDAVLADIDKFKELKEGDDKRFIDFVNQIRSSFHILEQLGRPSDLDNNAMLSRIEQS